MIIKQHHDSSIVTLFEKDRDHFLILFNRASLNCEFSCIIIETRILHLVSERRMAPCFGSLSCFRDLEIAVQRLPPEKRVGHLVPDELREVRAQHGQRPVLSAAGRLLGDSCDRVERG